MGKQKEVLEKLAEAFQIRHVLLRQALAECLGTLILVMFGCGAVAQLVLSRGSHGTFLSVNLAFGFAATLGILASGQVSGGHLNPAVTFALCLLRREPWRKFPLFFFFQTLGAFLGAAVVFGLYFDALQDFSQGELAVVGKNATAGIFATYPSKHLSPVNGFFDQFIVPFQLSFFSSPCIGILLNVAEYPAQLTWQGATRSLLLHSLSTILEQIRDEYHNFIKIIGTAALIMCILAAIDPHNNPVPPGLEPFTVGLAVSVIGLSMGFNSGYAVNPARDLGTRVFTALAGWGGEVFTANTYWFFVPTCAPFLGAVVGVLMYQLMIGYHLERDAQEKQKRKKEEEERLKLSDIATNEDA